MNTQATNFKIVLIGEVMVGKTMISNVLMNESFSDDYVPSVCASMVKVNYTNKITGEPSCISLWDTAGQERFKSLAPVFFQDSQAAIIVYDVSDENSFQRIHFWRELFLEHSQNVDSKFLIVGNKIDLRENAQNNQENMSSFISTDKGKELAISLNADFIETSAKTGKNINLLLNKMIEYAQSINKKTTSTVIENRRENNCFC